MTASSRSHARQNWIYGVTVAVCAAACSFATSFRPALTSAQIAALQANITQRAGYPVREDFFIMMHWTLAGNVRNMADVVLHNRLWLEWQLLSIFVLLPVLLPLLWLIIRLVQQSGLPARARRILCGAALVSTLSPLLMNLLGWDAVRWNVLCVLAGYLTLAILSRYLPQARVELSPAARNLIVLLIAVNMASGWGLFDGTQVNPYPFFPRALNEWWMARHPGMPLSGL